MTHESTSAVVDPRHLGWTDERSAAALSVALPNDRRVAAAALAQLTLDDHAAAFAAWCDAQPIDTVSIDPQR